ncbi:aldose 1-epimerase family protein [Flavobacterium dankookense]|uniref:Galactose mutarotase-like enzyme n=1 Tax=Flavobacterium dankookense TaxID=706186 RepID=A0A4R6QG58_9FLAO|nr:aldose 1-epimerase family protein [Flavobacterium dankookense]TDP61309.1 galactose mutarotase-like enzyme [Flavobacterium dankookense]
MEITISKSNLSATISSKGAELKSLSNSQTKREYIWNGNPEFWGKHSPILFPIVGTLKNNSYSYNDKNYELPRHGFARDLNFELIYKSDCEAIFSLKSYDETLKKYPFNFELQLIYTLSESYLTVCYKVFNENQFEMPFSIGGHPAFALNNNFDNYSLQFENDEVIECYLLENDLLSQKTLKIELKEKNLPLSYSLFKNDALVFKQLNSKKISLLENDKPILDFSFNDFPNFGIWTKQNAPFICLEPWLGYADTTISNGNILKKEGIYLLQPGCQKTAEFSIDVLKI